jgi:hypothetical protein
VLQPTEYSSSRTRVPIMTARSQMWLAVSLTVRPRDKQQLVIFRHNRRPKADFIIHFDA